MKRAHNLNPIAVKCWNVPLGMEKSPLSNFKVPKCDCTFIKHEDISRIKMWYSSRQIS
jgi:hypothetical protein